MSITLFQGTAITADTTVEIAVPRDSRRFKQVWHWQFEASGSGTNAVRVLTENIVNYEKSDTSRQAFVVDFPRPELVDGDDIDNATSNKYKEVHQVFGLLTFVKFQFLLWGGGSRTFTVSCWIE